MTILGVIGALIAAVGIALWRLNSAATSVRGLAEAAGDALGFWRRLMWRRRLAGDRLELVSDPKEAAAAMMVAVAEADGALTEREQAALLAAFAKTFDLAQDGAEEMLARARWTVGDSHDLDRVLYKLGRKLNLEQKRDTMRLLTETAMVSGGLSPVIRASLDKYSRALKA